MTYVYKIFVLGKYLYFEMGNVCEHSICKVNSDKFEYTGWSS